MSYSVSMDIKNSRTEADIYELFCAHGYKKQQNGSWLSWVIQCPWIKGWLMSGMGTKKERIFKEFLPHAQGYKESQGGHHYKDIITNNEGLYK